MGNAYKSLKNFIYKLNFVLNKKQKIYGIILIILSFIGALFETLGVGIILPYVQVLMNSQELMHTGIFGKVSNALKLNNSTQFIVVLTVMIILIFLLKNLFFMFLSWVRISYSCKIERELSYSIMQNIMRRGYLFFVTKNSGEIMRDVSTDTINLNILVYQILRIVSDIFIILTISVYILLTDWVIAIGVALMAVICLIIIYGFFRNSMKRAGKKYNYYVGKGNQYLLQAIQGIKEVLVMSKQKFFCDKYYFAVYESQKGKIQQTIGMEYPAYVIEGLCVTGLLATLCLRISMSGDGITDLIPTLSAFAIGAFRILPSLGRISSALNSANYHLPSLEHVYNHFHNAVENQGASDEEDSLKEEILFERSLELNNITWRYNDQQEYIFKNVSLKINKGQTVAFVGRSGAGKTTLVDIILNLITPLEGDVRIDDNIISGKRMDLSKIIGYVPQNFYLMDDSIKNNIAFGYSPDEIDEVKVWKALEMAQLSEWVRELPESLETVVGERGMSLSGGQRQRVSIARVLYNNPEILVFDEATSALDGETEKEVMESVESLKESKTIIIIAHRLSTIQKCDVIYNIENSQISQVSYNELINK